MTKNGFEKNIFSKAVKFEKAVLTPNGVDRSSIKEGNDSYNLMFNNNIDIDGLRDNLNRPVSELFFSFIWKGYFGWTLGPNTNLKEGYEFNLPLENNQPSVWWDQTNTQSDTGFLTNNYTSNGNVFYYVDNLNIGDIFIDRGFVSTTRNPFYFPKNNYFGEILIKIIYFLNNILILFLFSLLYAIVWGLQCFLNALILKLNHLNYDHLLDQNN